MKLKRFCFSVLTTCIAFLFTLTACNTSQDWVRKTIEKNYFRFDGDYSGLENMNGLSVEEMMDKLDIYSAHYSEEEYEAVLSDNAGNKSGVGVSYSFENGKGVVFHSVIGNSPAKKAGIKAGDIAVSAQVADGPVVKFEADSDFSDFVTARAEGEEFALNLSDGRTVNLAKAEYTASYVSMYTKDKTYEVEYDGGLRKIAESDGGISQLPEGAAYIYLSQFYGNAYEEMSDLTAVFNAEKCTSLILDLRNNGGGFVDLMAEIGGLFTASVDNNKHVAMAAKFKDGSQQVTYCNEYPRGSEKFQTCVVPKGTPVYVMANQNTASASEALIGILVSYDILKYENIFLSKYGDLPAKSYGKGIMQSVFKNFWTHEALKLTVAGIYWQNGKTIHGVGLTEADGCSVAYSSDGIVNVGYDDELKYVIDKIAADCEKV